MQPQALVASSGLGTAERKPQGEPERRASHGELSPKRRAWVAWVLPGVLLIAAPAHLATSAEVLPRSAPLIPPGSYQQKVSSGLLCERKTLLKNPRHLTGISTVNRPASPREAATRCRPPGVDQRAGPGQPRPQLAPRSWPAPHPGSQEGHRE